MANEKKNNNIGGMGNKSRKPRFNFNWFYLVLLAGLAFMYLTRDGGQAGKQLTYTDFQTCLDSGYVEEVLVNKDNLTLKFSVNTDGERHIFGDVAKPTDRPRVASVEFGSVASMEAKVDSARAHGRFIGKVSYEREDSTLWHIILQVGPILLLVVFWLFIMRGMGGGGMAGGIFSFGKSKAKLFEQDDNTPKVTFKDVAGQTEAKREVHEIVDFLKNPQKYTELGGKIPKGALLVGPPGTGKTLLAKAVAGEAGVPFFSMSGSDFVEMFVGVGASRVRDLFQQAKAKSPCIIFIDEIDAIGRARGNKANMGGNDERENTLNQLLTEMDGFGTNSGIIILAATNRADILDKALLRAGRFDRQIHVDLPDLSERRAIFNVHLRPIKIDETVDVHTLARQTPGFSGADIANVCNEAALIAARNNFKWVNKQCFLDAVDRIIGGLEKKTKVMTAAEKRAIALHEAGHATISWFCQYANPLVKVTIVPRGQALGAAWYMPEERQITTKEELLDEICSTLGGRAAEELTIGRISTGAMNDLEKVTKRSYGMIAYAGMSESLPNLCYYNNDEYAWTKPYSERTAELIDMEVKKLIAEQYERAKQILEEHKEGHEQLAQLLIDNEVIYAEDVERIFGKRPWVSRTEEILAANEEAQEPENDNEVSHEAENEAFIREKVLNAVKEKARSGDFDIVNTAADSSAKETKVAEEAKVEEISEDAEIPVAAEIPLEIEVPTETETPVETENPMETEATAEAEERIEEENPVEEDSFEEEITVEEDVDFEPRFEDEVSEEGFVESDEEVLEDYEDNGEVEDEDVFEDEEFVEDEELADDEDSESVEETPFDPSTVEFEIEPIHQPEVYIHEPEHVETYEEEPVEEEVPVDEEIEEPAQEDEFVAEDEFVSEEEPVSEEEYVPEEEYVSEDEEDDLVDETPVEDEFVENVPAEEEYVYEEGSPTEKETVEDVPMETEYVFDEPEYIPEAPEYVAEEPEYIPEEPEFVPEDEPEFVPEDEPGFQPEEIRFWEDEAVEEFAEETSEGNIEETMDEFVEETVEVASTEESPVEDKEKSGPVQLNLFGWDD